MLCGEAGTTVLCRQYQLANQDDCSDSDSDDQ